MHINDYQLYITYDPKKDRSEIAGYRRLCDESQPTEQEQLTWSKITVVVAVLLACVGVVLS